MGDFAVTGAGDGTAFASGTGRPGFALPGHGGVSGADAVSLAVAAIDAGFAPTLLTEVSGFAATAVAAAVAARRPGTVLGTAIVPLGSRTDATIAMEAASCASIAGAPFLLGVGVSTDAIVGGWHDAERDATVAATEARLRTLRRLLDGGRRGAFGLGAARGDVPVHVLLGALGPRMVELALTVGDGVVLNHTPPDHLPQVHGDATVLSFAWVRACDDAEERSRRELCSYATARPYQRHLTELGFGGAVDGVVRLHEQGRLREAPATLPDELVDLLYLRPEDVPARVAADAARGATTVVVPVTGDDPVAEVASLVTLLGPDAG